jgi:dihydropyrimidinase
MLSAANRGASFPYGKITFAQAVRLCAETPARIFGCRDKGSVSIGKDADLVLYDPRRTVTVSAGTMHSKCDHTIWEGLELHGYPVQTYLRGELVYDNGRYVGKPGMGRLIRRERFTLHQEAG